MTTIRWTNAAKADLRGIHAVIAQDSRNHANRAIGRLKREVARLRTFPESGARVLDWDRPDVREVLVGPHRVIYRYKDRIVRIIAVIHASRRLSNAPPDLDD